MGKKILTLVVSLLLVAQGIAGNLVYVSPEGNNSGDGSLKHPFLTIEKARDFIRGKRLAGNNEPFSILLRQGCYYLKQTVNFDSQDKNLTISSFKNEKAVITGAIAIDRSQIKSVAGSKRENLFPEKNRQQILMADLRKLGITDYGQMKPVGFGHQASESWMELFINGKPYHLSRWPNDSTVAMGNVLDKGSSVAEGDKDIRPGKFQYSGNRPSRWKTIPNIWIFGYFHYGWADDAVQLASIDTVEKVFTSKQPHLYGFVSKDKWNRWYAYNIPEETDAPGEYYIDRDEGILYFYNPGKIEKAEVSILEKPMLSFDESANITISNIAFEGSRGLAVELKSTERCRIQNCTIKNMGLRAIDILDKENGPVGKGNGVVNCQISEIGSGAIQLSGGNRALLEPANNYVENCYIHDFNRITRTYCAGIRINGVGNRISHCEIFNSPHTAILLSGNDHLIEYNDIHDVCQSTEDVGALYYGRNPSERGHLVQYNYFHRIGSNLPHVSAVYHDDGACGMAVTGNIFYKAGTWPVLIGGGSDNPYTNNIFIDCPVGICIDNRLENWASDWLKAGNLFEKLLNEIHYKQPPFSTKYPELAKYWDENPAIPKRNVVDRNIFVRVEKPLKNGKKWIEFTDNNLITNNDPGFVDEKNQNFELKDSSEIFRKVQQFKPIPFEKIGILKKRE